MQRALRTPLAFALVALFVAPLAGAWPVLHASACDELETGGCVDWRTRVAGTDHAMQEPATARSPDGATLYVGGSQEEPSDDDGDAFVAALDLATGQAHWSARHDGPAEAWDVTRDLAASPDGARVFAVGITAIDVVRTENGWHSPVYAAFARAYDAGTGALVWEHLYAPTATSLGATGHGAALSPDGATLHVAGIVQEGETDEAFLLALDAATGAQRWAQRYASPTSFHTLDARDDGGLIATGRDEGALAIVALDPDTGEIVWRASHPYFPYYRPRVLVAETQTFVVAAAEGGRTAVAAYAPDGAPTWTRTLGPAPRTETPGLALSSDGGRLVVAGALGTLAAATLLDAATGTTVWTHVLPLRGAYFGAAFDGAAVYVSGATSTYGGGDATLVRLAAADGTPAWVARVDGGGARDLGHAPLVHDGAPYMLSTLWISSGPPTGPAITLTAHRAEAAPLA